MNEKIRLQVILPIRAYNELSQVPDTERTYSRHISTWRGLKNALFLAKQIHHDYSETHGNGAAHRIRIEAFGTRATYRWWEELYNVMADSATGRHPFNAATVERYRQIAAEVEAEMSQQVMGRDGRWHTPA